MHSAGVIAASSSVSVSDQFITKQLYTSSKDITRGFSNYPISFQFGLPVPLGEISDNIAPLSYGNQEIFGFYHLTGLGLSATSRTQLVIAYDGTNSDAGFVSVTINGATYVRADTNTTVVTGTALVDGVTRQAVFFTFPVSLANSGFDEPDDTELPITWVI